MAWLAFDRGANDEAADVDSRQRWREIAKEIHAEICERGFNSELSSFVQAFGSGRLDASLLQMPLVGFLPPAVCLRCPLSGVKRKSAGGASMSAFDPKRTCIPAPSRPRYTDILDSDQGSSHPQT
jgi:hypothetical protein